MKWASGEDFIKFYYCSTTTFMPHYKIWNGQGASIEALLGQKQSLHVYAIVIHVGLTEGITIFLQILSLTWPKPYPKLLLATN